MNDEKKSDPTDNNKIHPRDLDLNGNGIPDYQELSRRVHLKLIQNPGFMQDVARQVVLELKSHPHTLFNRALAKVKGWGAWLGL